MNIPIELEHWLRGAGYEHYCFISWPHSKGMSKVAERIRDEIETQLSVITGDLHPSKPSVFLDEQIIPPGADWQRLLSHQLCKSITMVALCADIYFKPYHKWCCLEWTAMRTLSKKRLADEDYGAIIPIRLQGGEPVEPLSQVQYVDLSGVLTASRSFYTTQAFRRAIGKVVTQIVKVAGALSDRRSHSNCGEFSFSAEPVAFEVSRKQDFPTFVPPETTT